LIFRFGGAPEIFTSAQSMPSADVPDIIPRTSMGLEAMKRVKVIFNTEDAASTEERMRKACKE
jgi:hypothetical protein